MKYFALFNSLLLILVSIGLAVRSNENEQLKARIANGDADRGFTWTLNGVRYGTLDRRDTVRTLCRLQWFVYEKTGKYYLEDPGFDNAPQPQTSKP